MALPFLGLKGLWRQIIYRRRWRHRGTTRTVQDHGPDEVLGARGSLLIVAVKLWAYPFLFVGARALSTTATVLLTEAHRRLDGQLTITAA
ncbi:MAG: hypothetical protein ABIO70_25920 [Pseudomonadota bacterium]